MIFSKNFESAVKKIGGRYYVYSSYDVFVEVAEDGCGDWDEVKTINDKETHNKIAKAWFGARWKDYRWAA